MNRGGTIPSNDKRQQQQCSNLPDLPGSPYLHDSAYRLIIMLSITLLLLLYAYSLVYTVPHQYLI